MAKVAPRWDGKQWVVDLRGHGFGRHLLTVEGDHGAEVAATHAAYALLRRLEGKRVGGSPLLALPGTAAGRLGLDGECLFKFACDQFGARKEFETAGGEEYGARVLSLVRRELGHVRIHEFEPPAGADVLRGYRDQLVEGGKTGPRTRNNRLNVAAQVLAFCVEWGWLKAAPKRPKATVTGEQLYVPRFEFYTEAQFRELRAALFDGEESGRRNGPRPSAELRAAEVERRRLYLSLAFYTGMHTVDVDTFSADNLFMTALGTRFLRTNTKSAACVPTARFDAPEQLILDCRAELARLGRPWGPGEAVAGGPWGHVSRVLQRTAARAGLPPFNLRVARRSTARMLCMLGWAERDTSEYLGHVDQQMIRGVYARIEVDERSPIKVEWSVANSGFPWLAMRRPRKIVPFAEALGRATAGEE